MIIFVNRQDLISCWAEAGRSLDEDVLADIEEVAGELNRLGLDDKWLVFDGQCRICSFRQNIICPAGNDIDNQECEHCGNMTLMEYETPEWENDIQQFI